LIKVGLNDVIGKNTKGIQRDFVEQLFKITKYTTFYDLKNEAISFWGLEKQRDLYYLCLPNMHDLMQINKEENH
jgi:hypothetical protein